MDKLKRSIPEWAAINTNRDYNTTGTAVLPVVLDAQHDIAALHREITKLRNALKGVMQWRAIINQDPDGVMCGQKLEPMDVALQLFNGPVWDDAVKALCDE